MAETEMGALEEVLRLCARQAPKPWYPRVFVRQTGASKEDISEVIEYLLLERLLQRAPGDQTTGPGLVLTPLGNKVLSDPAALERLRNGRTFAEGDRGGVVREALEREQTPFVSRTLFAANILVFLYGIYLAARNEALQSFLAGLSGRNADPFRRWVNVLLMNGSINAEAWLSGQWWRLLTACFVHIGLLHLFMNMYMFWARGGRVEQVWGWDRFLVIYLIAGVVGSGVGLAHNTTIMELSDRAEVESISMPLAGASTALCGILAAEAVWVWLNGQYLPRSLLNRWRNNLVVLVVLIVFISFFPGISGWGHLGGAVAGALTALVLNYQRFGPNPWRWLALVALVPISLLGYGEIQRMRISQRTVAPFGLLALSDDSWKRLEELDYDKRFRPRIHTKMTDVERQAYRDRVERLLDMHPSRREELRHGEPQTALDFLDFARKQWSGYLSVVTDAGPYYQPMVIKLRDEDRAAITGHLTLFDMAEKCLRAGKQWTPAEEAALQKQRRRVKETRFTEEDDEKPAEPAPPKEPLSRDREDFKTIYLPAFKSANDPYAKLWDDSYSQVVRPAKERLDKVVEDRVKRLQALQKQMNEVAAKLDERGAYKDERAERARRTAIALLRERTAVLALVQKALREGSRWTDTAPREAYEHKDKVKELETECGAALEDIGAT